MIQETLFDSVRPSFEKQMVGIYVWNVQAAAKDRAIRQSRWLANKEDADIVVLTEIPLANSVHKEALTTFGYSCICSPPMGDRRTLIGSRVGAISELDSPIPEWTHRAPLAQVIVNDARIPILGAYIPSRGSVEERNVAKRQAQTAVSKVLPQLAKDSMLIAGDLNVVEPEPLPQYEIFGDWEYQFYQSFAEAGFSDVFRLFSPQKKEYSWFGRSGLGYRFDHAFASGPFLRNIDNCWYDHEARSDGLSDHSGLVLTVRIPATGVISG